MSERPILFQPPMVRALLAGTKTQTRRLISTAPRPGTSRKGPNLFEAGMWNDSFVLDPGNESWRQTSYRWRVGDRLWVREAWRAEARWDGTRPCRIKAGSPVYYAADPDPRDSEPGCAGRLRASMHMPRWASRLTLTVTEVRVQRLQDISEEDARAEGCPFAHDGQQYTPPPPEVDCWQGYGRASFSLLWSQINGAGSWDANPFVVALSFTVEQRNIDAGGAGHE